MSYQIVIIQGNLTRDAEVRQVGQSIVASLSIATSRRYKKADGTMAEETEYHDVELWNNQNVHPYLTKGNAVLVQGEIKTDKWNDQEGQTHERKKIRASLLQLCGRAQSQQPSAPRPAAPQYAPAPQYQQAPQYAPNPIAPAPQYPQAPPAPQAPQYQKAPAPQYQQPGQGVYAQAPAGDELPDLPF